MRVSNRLLLGMLFSLVVAVGFWLGFKANYQAGDSDYDGRPGSSTGASIPLPDGFSYPHQDVGGAEDFRRFDTR